MPYADLRDHDGHLLARLDPERWLLEIQRRGEKTLFDLREALAPNGLPLSIPLPDLSTEQLRAFPRYAYDWGGQHEIAPQSAKENDGERQGLEGMGQVG
jgi:hypothetical protein